VSLWEVLLKRDYQVSLKVLHILDHSLPYLSGYSYRTNYVLTHQKQLGIDPVALTSPKHKRMNGRQEVFNGITYYRCWNPTRLLADFPFVRESEQIRHVRHEIGAIFREEKPDIIHAHSPSLNGVPAIWAARRFDIPVVYELRAFWEDAAVDHGTFPEGSFKYWLSRTVETWLLKHVSAVTTLGRAMQQEIVRRGVPMERVHVCPNGVDLERFNPRTRDNVLARALGLEGKTVFGFIGSFYHYEGLDLLLQAMVRVVEQVPDVRLLLVGDGWERQNLEELKKSLGLGEHVVFVGRVSHDDVPTYYALMDVLVYPRRRMRLTEMVTPLKPLEAMAMGRVVLGSDVGGIRELVRHGETGFLFPADDLHGLTAQCVRLAGYRAMRERIGARGREFVAGERDWRKIVVVYRGVYEQLLGQR